jgi:DNA-binding Lrp family transcriptional regulator
MSYVRLVPSTYEYAEKFRLLDATDFKIIRGMYEHGFSSLSKLSDSTGIPKQTLSYHARKLDKQDIVRFRALLNEPKIGLKSFTAIASAALGKEDVASRALTCFPLWRYLAVVDGWRRGSCVRYAIPPDRERDLNAFLSDLKQRGLVSDFQVVPTTSPSYPLLNLEFYGKRTGFALFAWDKWVNDFDSFSEVESLEPTNYEKAKVDLYDLMVLRCLEINARTKQRRIVKEIATILGEEENTRLISLVSRRTRSITASGGLIRGYRAYLFPNPVPTAMFLMYRMTFANSSSLKKFMAGLHHLPYNTSYEKILDREELLLRLIIPAYESTNLWGSITELAKRGHIKEALVFLGDLEHKTWDNVEIYQMFREGTWNFSYGIAEELLEKALASESLGANHAVKGRL